MSPLIMHSIFRSLSKPVGCCSLILVLFLFLAADLTNAFYILENPAYPFGGRAVAVRGKRNVALQGPEQSAFLVEWVEPGEMPFLQQSHPIQVQMDQGDVDNDVGQEVYVIEVPQIDDHRQVPLLSDGGQPNEFSLNEGRFMKPFLPEQLEDVDQSARLAYPAVQPLETEEEESNETMMNEILLRKAQEEEAKRREAEQSEVLQQLLTEAMREQEEQQMVTDQMDYLQRANQLKESLRSKRSQPAIDLSTAFELANEYGQALLAEDVERAFQMPNSQPTEFLIPMTSEREGNDDDRFQWQRGKRLSPASYQLVMIP